MDQLTSVALAISLLGGIHDLITRRIPNWLTLPAMALGLTAQVYLLGLAGGLNGLGGIAIGFALFFPIYALGHMGAGDVKLLMAVGAWIGWHDCLKVAVVSIFVGAVFALGEIIWRGRLKIVVMNFYSFLRALAVPGLVAEKLKIDETRKFAFGLCVAIAVAGVEVARRRGIFP